MKKFEIILQCCGTQIELPSLNESAVGARRPDDISKNVECPQCKKLVILSFEKIGNNIENVNQKVIVI